MKDFTPYGLIIGLSIMIILGIGEQAYFENVVKDMKMPIEESEKMFYLGNLEKSQKNIQDAIIKWEKHEKTLNILMDNAEVNDIYKALLETNSKLKFFLTSNNVSANFVELKEYIISIERENKFTLGNIL